MAKSGGTPLDDDPLTPYREIPKKHWRQMSGRDARVIIDQAKRYGAPLQGPTVDLTVFVRWFHEFLAEHGRDFGAKVDEKTRKTQLEADRLAIKLARERGQVVSIDEVRGGLSIVGTLLRQGMQDLQQRFGNDAFALMDGCLKKAEAAIERALPAADGGKDDGASTE